MKRFEYRTIGVPISEKKEKVRVVLDELGAEGWELVSVVSYDQKYPQGAFEWLVYYEESATGGFVLFLKRELI